MMTRMAAFSRLAFRFRLVVHIAYEDEREKSLVCNMNSLEYSCLSIPCNREAG